jgi:Ca-activated chloride channel family protein
MSTAASHWFAYPWALYALALLPALSLLGLWAHWRRARGVRRLGNPFFVQRLLVVSTGRRRLQSALIFLGILLLILGMAGPRWGAVAAAPLLGGKDVVIVLDASRSMLAEQPSRFERARRSLRDLADQLELRGGHRVALVVFAAHAKLLFPLTADYSHFRWALEALDADDLPPALRPRPDEKAASGTRLGEALRLAVAAHDPQRAGWRDVLLLSDGDDPAGDDEWTMGVEEARRQQMPVHVVAVGDPRAAHPIPHGNDVLRFEGAVIESRLNETLLEEIARRTRGFYFPAHTSALPLGRLLRGYLNTRPAEAPEPPAADVVLEAQPRYAGFLVPALLLLAGSMLIGDGPRRPSRGMSEATTGNPRDSLRSSRGLVLLLVPMLLSAGPLPSVEDLLRKGNDAFKGQQYEQALQLYEQAATHTADPGLVAFNKAAALYRLERYAEAAAHWQRCLEDGEIGAPRKARACYDLGNALLQQAGTRSRRLLEQAVAAYRQCLDSQPDADLRADALYNLELARWLWLKARAQAADDPGNDERPPNTPNQEPETRFNGQRPQLGKNGNDAANAELGKKNGPDGAVTAAQKKLAQGSPVVLPDQDQVVPLSADESLATLERLIERMRLEARAHRQALIQAATNVKDW